MTHAFISEDPLVARLDEALAAVPMLDAHTHLTVGKLNARGLHDLMLYHMIVSDLYAAGCPSGARLTEFPGVPDKAEAHARIREALPYMPLIQNTSCNWGLRILLHDLFNWDEPITADNWEYLDGLVRERADDKAVPREIIQQCNIHKLTTELARRGNGEDDDLFHYSLEWAFFTRTQRGEYDTTLYELERCWGQPTGSPIPHAASGRPAAARTIRTLDDVKQAVRYFIDTMIDSGVLSYATHVSTDVGFRTVTDEQMTAALARRDVAGREERDIYTSYINEVFLTMLEADAPQIAFQFSYAAEPLPHETASLLPQSSIADMAEIAARHPKVKFVCLEASRHGNQSLCTLGRELPNFSLMGYWWHNFFPGAMRQVMEERLDMLPMNKNVGFFSDAYTIEWTYAKARLVRRQLAFVLAQKIRQGQYDIPLALDIARHIFYNTAQDILCMEPVKVSR
ncbi:MAG TPA: hypothetical protein VGL77_18030, partial [Armatimonadota bacterium]|jgi:hypothetical protein